MNISIRTISAMLFLAACLAAIGVHVLQKHLSLRCGTAGQQVADLFCGQANSMISMLWFIPGLLGFAGCAFLAMWILSRETLGDFD